MIDAKCVTRVVVVAAALLTATNVAAAESSGDDPAIHALAPQVHQKIEQLQAVRADRRRAQQLHDQQVAELDRQIARLDADQQQVDEALQRQRAELDRLTSEFDAVQGRVDRARLWLRQFHAAVLPLAHDVAGRIERGITFDREARLAPVQRAASVSSEDMDHAASTPIITAALQRIAEDLAAAQRIELANHAILLQNPARRVDVWRLRLGLAGELFVSEDGQMRGVWSGRAWHVNPPQAVADQIDEVFSIVRQKQPPRLIGLPLEFSPPANKGRAP